MPPIASVVNAFVAATSARTRPKARRLRRVKSERHDQQERDHGQHDQRELHVHHEQHDQDQDQLERVVEDGRDAGLEELLDGLDVAGDARRQHAHGVPVEEGQPHALDARKTSMRRLMPISRPARTDEDHAGAAHEAADHEHAEEHAAVAEELRPESPGAARPPRRASAAAGMGPSTARFTISGRRRSTPASATMVRTLSATRPRCRPT